MCIFSINVEYSITFHVKKNNYKVTECKWTNSAYDTEISPWKLRKAWWHIKCMHIINFVCDVTHRQKMTLNYCTVKSSSSSVKAWWYPRCMTIIAMNADTPAARLRRKIKNLDLWPSYHVSALCFFFQRMAAFHVSVLAFHFLEFDGCLRLICSLSWNRSWNTVEHSGHGNPGPTLCLLDMCLFSV